MLASIHPLGERTRHNRWWLTVGTFALGSVAGGALMAGAAGWAGSLVLGEPAAAPWAGAVLVAAGLADLARVPVPGPHRQVNERWIGVYRGWVYGGGFGVQLGVGFATYVVTWGTYALVAVSFLVASASTGAAFGAVFGLGRALPLLAAGRIDRPSRLGLFHETMAQLGRRVHRAAAIGVLGLGVMVLVVL